MLIFQKYSIFKKFLDIFEKNFGVGALPFPLWKFFVKKFFDVAQNMPEAFLLGESWYLAYVGVPEISDENALEKASEMINYDLGTPAFINMVESNVGIGEYPKPVIFPAGFVTSDYDFAVFKVFLNMFRSMVAWRNILVAAVRTKVKKNVNGFIDMVRFFF